MRVLLLFNRGGDVSHPEIRMFDVTYGRSGQITYRVVCNGALHFVCDLGDGSVPHSQYMHNRRCDGQGCQESGSQPIDTSLLSVWEQHHLGMRETVPFGCVLAIAEPAEFGGKSVKGYVGGQKVAPKALQEGILLCIGMGVPLTNTTFGISRVTFVRNIDGQAKLTYVGQAGKKRTAKKLARLQRRCQGPEVNETQDQLNALISWRQELSAQPSTPFVEDKIERASHLIKAVSELARADAASRQQDPIQLPLSNQRAEEIAAHLAAIEELLPIQQATRELEQSTARGV